MKWSFITQMGGWWAFVLCLASPIRSVSAQFVQLTTEIQICDWDYLFFCDRNAKYPGEPGVPSIFTEDRTRRCVVGADTWMIQSTNSTSVDTRWFTGTNIIAHSVIAKQTPDAVVRKLSAFNTFRARATPGNCT